MREKRKVREREREQEEGMRCERMKRKDDVEEEWPSAVSIWAQAAYRVPVMR